MDSKPRPQEFCSAGVCSTSLTLYRYATTAALPLLELIGHSMLCIILTPYCFILQLRIRDGGARDPGQRQQQERLGFECRRRVVREDGLLPPADHVRPVPGRQEEGRRHRGVEATTGHLAW